MVLTTDSLSPNSTLDPTMGTPRYVSVILRERICFMAVLAAVDSVPCSSIDNTLRLEEPVERCLVDEVEHGRH